MAFGPRVGVDVLLWLEEEGAVFPAVSQIWGSPTWERKHSLGVHCSPVLHPVDVREQ